MKIHASRVASGRGRRSLAAGVGTFALVSALAGCSGLGSLLSGSASSGGNGGVAQLARAGPPVANTRMPSPAVSELTTTAPGALTAQFARAIFRSAPIVVIAEASGSRTALHAASHVAHAVHAPLLLDTGLTAPAAATPLVQAVRALHTGTALAEGLTPAQLSALKAALPGVRVVTSPAQLPVTGTPPRLARLAVLVPGTAAKTSGKAAKPGSAAGAPSAAVTAVSATALAAGAAVVPVTGGDPRTDPKAIAALAKAKPHAVVAVGAQFGTAALVGSRVAAAETGYQLPGGGQVMFPGRRLVALYGAPGTPGLGVLGRQDLDASIARAKQMAAPYQPLSSVPVIPAFEIITTVAEASPGPDGSYSYETPISDLLPWIRKATASGLYVVLDLQPGRSNLLTQAKAYTSLLEMPDVGLALDAEWKLQPGQVPLKQIGSVNVSEVNSVISWLATLTARHHLPQKLLVLHQFRLSMLIGEKDLDTSHDDLSIVIHMDGQGTPGAKWGTWAAVTGAAPPGVRFGWKDFLVMDHPMLSPQQTMTATPTPVMISYQ